MVLSTITNVSPCIIVKTLVFVIIAIIAFHYMKLLFSTDSFQNPVQKVRAKDPYDNFYAPVYSSLISDMIIDRTKFEVKDLIEKTSLSKYNNPKLLDIGCGGGDHLRWLAKENIYQLELTGIDKSSAMLKQNKLRIGDVENIPRFINKDINSDDIFQRASFSHITCYYFTLYYVNSTNFMKNIRKWLRPKGWFVVHVVDLEKFDPMLDAASPFRGIDPQKYVKNRITESTVVFKKFTYKANFILKKNKVLFDETFKFKNIPKIRNQTHTLQKIDVEKFIDDMGRYGLELKKTTTLDSKGYKEQNILYFQKS